MTDEEVRQASRRRPGPAGAAARPRLRGPDRAARRARPRHGAATPRRRAPRPLGRPRRQRALAASLGLWTLWRPEWADSAGAILPLLTGLLVVTLAGRPRLGRRDRRARRPGLIARGTVESAREHRTMHGMSAKDMLRPAERLARPGAKRLRNSSRRSGAAEGPASLGVVVGRRPAAAAGWRGERVLEDRQALVLAARRPAARAQSSSRSGELTLTSTVLLRIPSIPVSAPKPPVAPGAIRSGSAGALWPTARIRRSTRIDAGGDHGAADQRLLARRVEPVDLGRQRQRHLATGAVARRVLAVHRPGGCCRARSDSTMYAYS